MRDGEKRGRIGRNKAKARERERVYRSKRTN